MDPSSHAVYFSITADNGNTYELCWDYVRWAGFSYTGNGLNLLGKGEDGRWALISAVDEYYDHYPQIPDGMSGREYTVRQCIKIWNQKIRELFFSNDPHPIDEEAYQYYKANLVWNEQTRQFNELP